jgi:capsular exopolysaccharide synthesis family protein
VAADLAAALAHTGRGVILVDADLARPAQAHLFSVKNESGLAALLMVGVKDATDLVVPTCVENLRLLVAGTAGFESAEPAAVLMSKRLSEVLEQLAARCDALILDTPAVLDCHETAWLSARCDGTMVVLDARRARVRTVKPALATLSDAGATVFGVVLNRARGRAVADRRIQSQAVEQLQPASDFQTASSGRPGSELVRPQGIAGPATDGS